MEQQKINEAESNLLITPYLEQGQLPEFMNRALSVADNPQSRDMLFLSLIVHSAYAMPNMCTYHGKPRKEYGPELMLMVLAAAASGKGIMGLPRKLLRDIEGKNGKQIFIPANTSSSGLLELLEKFNGRGIISATEMDTMSQTLKSSYGQYSDIIRCAFEHEPISLLRRTNKEFIELRNPHLAMLLSGTINQLTPLLRSRENGLASRFMTYVVSQRQGFRYDVFDSDDTENDEADLQVYEKLATELGDRYLWMVSSQHKCYFKLSDTQRREIKDFYKTEYDAYLATFGENIIPTLNRMPVIMKRIGMILAGFRLNITKPLPTEIECSEDDFKTMKLLGHKLLMHAGTMYKLLPDSSSCQLDVVSPAMLQQQYFDMLDKQFSKNDADEAAKSIGLSVRTTERWLNHWVKEGKTKHCSHGCYQKIA